MSSKNKILILTDGKAGHENQSKAFVRALGREFDIVQVKFRSPFAKTLSYLFDRIGIRTPMLFSGAGEVMRSGEYAAVVGTGSGTFYAAKTIAHRLGIKCGVVLYPRGYSLDSFDCIMAPAFDNPNEAENIVKITANLVSNDRSFYEEGVRKFAEHYKQVNGRDLKRPVKAVSVIIGGPNKCSTMTPEWMKAELDRVFAESRKSLLWVTTSRRTPADVEAVVESYPWDYRLIYSKDHFNPIPAFVKLSKRLYVTAESTGMISEACTCGAAEVCALDNLNPGNHKFRQFVDRLVDGGYLDGNRKIELRSELVRAKSLLGL